MYKKVQDSGLTEIVPLICTSAIWDYYSVFSHLEFPQGKLLWSLQQLTSRGGGSILPPSWIPSKLTIRVAVILWFDGFVYWYGRQYFSFTWFSCLIRRKANKKLLLNVIYAITCCQLSSVSFFPPPKHHAFIFQWMRISANVNFSEYLLNHSSPKMRNSNGFPSLRHRELHIITNSTKLPQW